MKIELNFAKKTVTIEGTHDEAASLLKHVKDVAPSLTEIKIVVDGAAGAADSRRDTGRDSAGGSRQEGVPKTLRDFAKSLAPSIMVERIAVIAYYVCKLQNKDAFTPKEMSDWL